MELIQVNPIDVKFLMSNGYVRKINDDGYQTGKSIQEYYGLDTDQIAMLFRDPAMKGIRVRKQPALQFVIVEGPATITSLPVNGTAVVNSTTNDDDTSTETIVTETVDTDGDIFEVA